jgi:hypothetical protein
MPRTARTALRRGTIRPPRTVGRRWSSVATMTSDTNPMRFVHACAVRSWAQRSRIGAQPATKRVPRIPPTATFPSASVYPSETIGRRIIRPLRPDARTASATHRIPVR